MFLNIVRCCGIAEISRSVWLFLSHYPWCCFARCIASSSMFSVMRGRSLLFWSGWWLLCFCSVILETVGDGFNVFSLIWCAFCRVDSAECGFRIEFRFAVLCCYHCLLFSYTALIFWSCLASCFMLGFFSLTVVFLYNCVILLAFVDCRFCCVYVCSFVCKYEYFVEVLYFSRILLSFSGNYSDFVILCFWLYRPYRPRSIAFTFT